MRRRLGPRYALPALALVLSLLLSTVWASPARAGDERLGHRWMTLVDEDGATICVTGFDLEVGDEYVDEDNALWRVARVTGEIAAAVYVKTLDLSSAVADFRLSLAETPRAQQGGSQVGIYHTHSDESYVPTDGTHSDPTGHGGVYRVGDRLTDALSGYGVRVVHSQASHMPHDGAAYERSRPTAMEVLRGSAAIFDVHRDAAPPEAYRRVVGGVPVTQIMMVVGRVNPQVEANLGFAEALKAATDSARPGLIRGILKTGGGYNQDLSSRALLLEVGAHTNKREEAESAVSQLASVVPSVLGAAGTGIQGRGLWRAVAIILLLTVVGGGLYLYIATGGNWRAAWDKLRRLGEEFATYLGRTSLRRGARRGRR